jgi:hypothetical protein
MLKRDVLVLYLQHLSRVVDRAIPVVIVANRAVKHVIAENPIECFPLRTVSPARFRLHLHAFDNRHRAGALELTIHFDQASVTGLDRAQLMMIANCRYFCVTPLKQIN